MFPLPAPGTAPKAVPIRPLPGRSPAPLPSPHTSPRTLMPAELFTQPPARNNPQSSPKCTLLLLSWGESAVSRENLAIFSGAPEPASARAKPCAAPPGTARPGRFLPGLHEANPGLVGDWGGQCWVKSSRKSVSYHSWTGRAAINVSHRFPRFFPLRASSRTSPSALHALLLLFPGSEGLSSPPDQDPREKHTKETSHQRNVPPNNC